MLEGYLVALANLDEFIAIIRKSKTRDEARVKLLAFEWTRQQVERWGILIRSEERLNSGPLCVNRAAGGCDFGTAFVPIDGTGNRQG